MEHLPFQLCDVVAHDVEDVFVLALTIEDRVDEFVSINFHIFYPFLILLLFSAASSSSLSHRFNESLTDLLHAGLDVEPVKLQDLLFTAPEARLDYRLLALRHRDGVSTVFVSLCLLIVVLALAASVIIAVLVLLFDLVRGLDHLVRLDAVECPELLVYALISLWRYSSFGLLTRNVGTHRRKRLNFE